MFTAFVFLTARKFPATLDITRDGPAHSRKLSKVVEVVRGQWKIVGRSPPPAFTLLTDPLPPLLAAHPSLPVDVALSVSPVAAVSSLSRFLLPLCLAPSRCPPPSWPPSLSVSVSPSCSFGSFLTSNHLGPRTSAVSRSFLAAAFRHFPPDRARASGKRHFVRSRLRYSRESRESSCVKTFVCAAHPSTPRGTPAFPENTTNKRDALCNTRARARAHCCCRGRRGRRGRRGSRGRPWWCSVPVIFDLERFVPPCRERGKS